MQIMQIVVTLDSTKCQIPLVIMQYLEASADKDGSQRLKALIVSEASIATSTLRDALSPLTSVFKFKAIDLLE